MKVLICHPGVNFSVADVYNGLAKGLRQNGCEVGMFNLDDRIEFYTSAHIPIPDTDDYRLAFETEAAMGMAAKGIEVVCYEWWPDVVIIVSGFYIPPSVWQALSMRPHHVVYWATESPYEDDRQADPARFADTVILNDPVNVDHYREHVNPNTHYLPHSYDPDVHHPGPTIPDLAADFAFVGTGFPSRIDWFESVDWSGINARFGGNWQGLEVDSPLMPLLYRNPDHCMENTATADVYRSAKVSMNLYRKETTDGGTHHGWAMGPREVELAACGTFFFREPRPEGDDLFPMLPLVSSPAEFADELRWWLAHDAERCAAADAARSAIVGRTFRNTAGRLLEIIQHARKIAA